MDKFLCLSIKANKVYTCIVLAITLAYVLTLFA